MRRLLTRGLEIARTWLVSPHGQRGQKIFEVAITTLALLSVPLMIFDDPQNAAIHGKAEALGWIIWVAFCVDFVLPWITDGIKGLSWFDFAIIALTAPFASPDRLEGVRALRAIRPVIRLLRFLKILRPIGLAAYGFKLMDKLLGRRNLPYTFCTALVVIFVGGLLVLKFEGPDSALTRASVHASAAKNANDAAGDAAPGTINSTEDALWWAVTTATTVGYGDMSPKTSEGRAIAVLLMLIGIGVTSIFTGLVANHFFRQDDVDVPVASQQIEDLKARLDGLERKLDLIIQRIS